MQRNKLNSILLAAIAMATLSGTPSFAESYVQSPSDNLNYYQLGMSAMKKSDYTTAIEYLKKALAKSPNNSSIWNNLAAAYTSKGTYLYNKEHDLENAANNYRKAIYYLEYYNKTANTDIINQNIAIAHQNLDSVLTEQHAKKDSLSRLKKAKELRGKGDLVASVAEYAEAAKDTKYSYEAYAAMADVMQVLSNTYGAAIYYDKALASNSNDPFLHLKFGRALYKLGNIDRAVKELDIASDNAKTKDEALNLLQTIWEEKIAKNPNDPVAQMNLGTVYQNKGDLDMAMVKYKTAQSIDPRNQMIRVNMATVLQQQGNYSQAIEIYNDILKIKPNDITVNSYKAATLAKMGKQNDAITIYKNLLAAHPGNKAIKNQLLHSISNLPDISALNQLSELAEKMPNDSDVHYQYAYTLHQNKRYDDALAEYQKSIAINNNNLDAYLNMITIYRQNKDVAKVEETLNKANLLFPNNDKIQQMYSDFKEEKSYNLMEKAANLYNKKDYNDAIITYRAIEKPDAEVYLGIGACYQAMERYDEAISNYKKALAMDTSNPNAHYFLGLAYLYKKDYTNAETYLKKAKELDDLNPDIADAYKSLQFAKSEVLMNKGIKLFDANKNDDAIINFNNAINTCNENGYAYYYRGLAYDTKGDSQKAINDYKKAVSLDPELTMAYYSMALSYDSLKNTQEAKKMYQKFINEYHANDEYTTYAKQRLSEIK